jgi:CRP-like cAMP-binding protein
MIRRLERRSPLGPADREALLSLPHNVRRLGQNGHVIRDGDSADNCALLLSGFAFRYKITGHGGRQIISLHIASEFLDLQHSFLGVADTSVQTLTECDVAFIPSRAIEELILSNPAVGRALWMDTLIDSSIFREWVVNVGRRDSRARVAHMLCEFSLRLEAAGHGGEPPLRAADDTGAARRCGRPHLRPRQQGASPAQEEGLIDRDRRHHHQRLGAARDVGDFNERYLHHDATMPARA